MKWLGIAMLLLSISSSNAWSLTAGGLMPGSTTTWPWLPTLPVSGESLGRVGGQGRIGPTGVLVDPASLDDLAGAGQVTGSELASVLPKRRL